MAAPERADDEREQAVETTGVRPDESGARLRTHAAVPIEEDDEEELELVEVVVAPRRRAAAIPPPPPRRAPHPERFDLDELLRDTVRSPALGPVVPPLDLEPPTAESMSGAAPRSRPQHGIAIVVGTTSIIAGVITAIVLMAPRGAEPTAAPAQAIEPAIVAPEVVEAPVAAPEPIALPEVPVAIVPAPEPPKPETELAAPTPLAQQRSRVARRAAAVHEAEEAPAVVSAEDATRAAESEAAETEAAETEASETAAAAVAEESVEPTAAALPERPTREDVDAAVDRIMPALRACGQGMDLITLELHFASSGRATTATTHARHLTPEQRSCVARAARTARVPPFSAPHLSVHYPVRL